MAHLLNRQSQIFLALHWRLLLQSLKSVNEKKTKEKKDKFSLDYIYVLGSRKLVWIPWLGLLQAKPWRQLQEDKNRHQVDALPNVIRPLYLGIESSLSARPRHPTLYTKKKKKIPQINQPLIPSWSRQIHSFVTTAYSFALTPFTYNPRVDLTVFTNKSQPLRVQPNCKVF